MGINLFPVTEQIFLLGKFNWVDMTKSVMSKITYDPAARDDRVKITIGTIDTNIVWILDRLASEFNRRNSVARMEVICYSQGTSNEERVRGMEKLDMALVQGTGPDLIFFSRLDVNKYVRKGALADMTDMLNNDTRINRADLFENILDAGFVDGKFYHAITDFVIFTQFGKTSLFGDGSDMTALKINEVLKQYPNAEITYEYTGITWLRDCMMAGISSYLDWENATCNFDNPEFIALLELAKRFPTENNTRRELVERENVEAYHNALDNYLTAFKENRALLIAYDIHDTRRIREFTELFGEEVSCLGFPSPDGAVSSISAGFHFGISESSQHKEEAWEFISMMMTDREVNEIFYGGMWINRAIFEDEAAKEKTPVMERSTAGGLTLYFRSTAAYDYVTYFDKSEIDEERFANYHLTEAEVQRIRDAIGSATRVDGIDMQAWAIVNEEAEAFLSGTRSAEETARIIQNRVGIYMSENS